MQHQNPAGLALGPRVSDLVGVGWGLGICISAKFSWPWVSTLDSLAKQNLNICSGGLCYQHVPSHLTFHFPLQVDFVARLRGTLGVGEGIRWPGALGTHVTLRSQDLPDPADQIQPK